MQRAIQSVLAQSVSVFEIVVIDDGSTDGSADVVRTINDPRIRVVCQKNQGVSVARNLGITEAKCELIAFLDADDEWLPDFIKTVGELVVQFPHAAVWATGYDYASPCGRRWSPLINGLPNRNPQILENYFGVASQSDPPLWSSAVVVRKDAIREVGGFPAGVTAGEDLVTWARLASVNEIGYDPKPMAVYHLGTWAYGIPTRPNDDDDYVGRALVELAKGTTTREAKDSVHHYIAWWHKTRASLFLRLGMGRRSAIEASKGIKYDPRSWKLFLYLPASLLPGTVFIWAVRVYSNIRRVIKPGDPA